MKSVLGLYLQTDSFLVPIEWEDLKFIRSRKVADRKLFTHRTAYVSRIIKEKVRKLLF